MLDVSRGLPLRDIWITAPFFIPMGLWCLLNPRSATLFGRRWQFQGEVEPSDAALLMTRVAGVFSLLAGIAVISVSVVLIIIGQ